MILRTQSPPFPSFSAGSRTLLQVLLEKQSVHVAELLYLLGRHAVLQQGLLQLEDLVGRDLAHFKFETRFSVFQRQPFMELRQDLFQYPFLVRVAAHVAS